MALSFLQFYRNQKYSSQYLHITPVTGGDPYHGFHRVTEISPIFQSVSETQERGIKRIEIQNSSWESIGPDPSTLSLDPQFSLFWISVLHLS